jgi:hypothetical protein
MAALWALPFAVYAIAQEPSEARYHLFPLKFFIPPIITTIVTNENKKITQIWQSDRHWVKILIVCGGYAVSSVIALMIVSGGGYYGGDGGGSYALFLLPSIAIYAAIGAATGTVMSLLKMRRRVKG